MPKIENHQIIQRQLFPKIITHVKKPEITLIVGARQVGKTVLLNMLKEWLMSKKKVSPKNILYFNLDIVRDWEFFQNQTNFIEFLKEQSQKEKIYVLVDEAQRVPDCSRFFKGVYDSNLNIKLILTGSTSLELKTRFKESLTGRKQVFHLYSFSFNEFLEAKDKKLVELFKKKNEISEISKKKILELFREYTVWGGYPRVVFAKTRQEKIAILAEIYSSYIEKDIVGLLEIKNRLGFSKLVKLLAGQIGQLVNVNELANSLNLDRETVERYLKALEETFIITPLLPYFKNPRQEIVKQNKIYFNDTGIRNYALENFSSLSERLDAGLLLENALFREILLALDIFQKIRFWRTKQGAEVDFLVLEREKIVPIEVKLNIKKPVISLSLRNFIKKYSPQKALVVNLSKEAKIKINKTNIYFLYPYLVNLSC
ncbi:MAG: ATPase [Candidatus Nealsonbacteria bacterium CG03_land_8_20_14_0_80_36_12]|uniref:ATPase n=1 Tax=Candidatus Nealsonbacteria bacterium CG03_land_8_20_14_0_80_36_12 TaxID=1974701 RepID=A0A2M7BYP2_9BACT|nr:MAG: ATPase [Candidatus Nealsonbacteria bacterium CG03_land_8_20_14_0_80_36_12]